MSLSVSGVGTIQPAAPTPPVDVPLYGQNETATASATATTLGAELGAAAVVYEPSASDESQELIYSSKEGHGRSASLPPAAFAEASREADQADAALSGAIVQPTGTSVGDDAVVAMTGNADMPPPVRELPDTPLSEAVKDVMHNVWAPVGPVAVDPATTITGMQPAQQGQLEAAAQATYAAVANASVSGAAPSDLHKFA